jgi:hypothetical protein
MATLRDYVKIVENATGMLPTWQPDVALELGDIVTAEYGKPNQVVWNIHRDSAFAQLPEVAALSSALGAPASPVSFDHEMSYSVSASAGAGPVGTADVTFQTDRSHVVITAAGTQDSYDSLGPVQQLIAKLYADGVWKRGWNLVVNVRHYPTITLALSDRRQTSASIALTAPAAPGIPIAIESLQAGVKFAVKSGTVQQWASAQPTTPFFLALGYNPYSNGGVYSPSHDGAANLRWGGAADGSGASLSVDASPGAFAVLSESDLEFDDRDLSEVFEVDSAEEDEAERHPEPA